jgi:hypothetical protein
MGPLTSAPWGAVNGSPQVTGIARLSAANTHALRIVRVTFACDRERLGLPQR